MDSNEGKLDRGGSLPIQERHIFSNMGPEGGSPLAPYDCMCRVFMSDKKVGAITTLL